MDWNYWIQSGLYQSIVRLIAYNDEYFSDFEIRPFKFIVVNKNNLTPLIWDTNDSGIKQSIFYISICIK